MKILLLGSTGNVGSRLLSALIIHSHTPILYVRNPAKLPQELLTSIPSSNIVVGDATDSTTIAAAIRDHECEAVICAAGMAGMFSRTEQFPAIFRAVVEATASVGRQRGRPVRCWMLGGWGMLDVPGHPNRAKITDYLPVFPDHRQNFALLQTLSEQEIAWSMLCAYQMFPSKDGEAAAQAKASTSKIKATTDVPPDWSTSLSWIPLIGSFLNVFANAGSYFTTLEQAAEVVVRDLDQGLSSEFVYKRVGIKVLS